MAEETDFRTTALTALAGYAAGVVSGVAVGVAVSRSLPAAQRRGERALAPALSLASRPEPATVWIVAPVIGHQVAEEVLAQLDRLPAGVAPTIVLHTHGGIVGACIMIASALRQLPRSTAVVPYFAHSGGTMIALSASTIAMGGNATLSAVDPIIRGQRARHIPDDKKHARLRRQASEYDAAVSRYLRDLLERRLPPAQVRRGMAMFMGEDAPHEWPIRREDVRSLGLPVVLADKKWARQVDAIRETQTIWP